MNDLRLTQKRGCLNATVPFFIDGGLSPHLSKLVYNRICAGLVRRCLPARCPCECPEGVRIGWVLYGFRIGWRLLGDKYLCVPQAVSGPMSSLSTS